MTCRLCRRERPRLARSHIVPFGFISRGRKEHSLVSVGGDGHGRFLRKAVYDEGILCDDCEHDVFGPYDDYAIRVLRDHEGMEWAAGEDLRVAVFGNVDRRMIRGFFASFLWRASVSTQPECAHVSLGKRYEDLIAGDLLEGGKFGYIDALITYLKNAMYDNFLFPTRTRWEGGANGYKGFFPHMSFNVAIDQRLPKSLDTMLHVKIGEKVVGTSLSLSDAWVSVPYAVAEADYFPEDVKLFTGVISEYFNKAKHHPRIPADKRRNVSA